MTAGYNLDSLDTWTITYNTSLPTITASEREQILNDNSTNNNQNNNNKNQNNVSFPEKQLKISIGFRWRYVRKKTINKC